MDHVLSNGDIVRILTSPQGKPSRDWLKIARSNRTRNKIRAYFRQQDRAEREERLVRGRELLEREIVRRYPNKEVTLEGLMPQINHIGHELGYGGGEDLILAVGGGNQTPQGVLARLGVDRPHGGGEETKKEILPPPPPRKEVDAEIVVEGAEGVLVSLAQCCRPVPGDPITGCVTKSRGITIHRGDCPNVTAKGGDRLVTVAWGNPKQSRYVARVCLEGVDRPGFFSDVTQAIGAADGGVVGIKASVAGGTRARMSVEVQVRDVEHLYRVMARLSGLNGVQEVQRG